MRIASLGRSEAWCEAFCKEVMLCNFARDRNIDDRELMAEILASLGLEAGSILQQATCETTKAQLREAADAATRYGIFGAPSFIVGDEPYWGNDRLEDALSVAVQDRR